MTNQRSLTRLNSQFVGLLIVSIAIPICFFILGYCPPWMIYSSCVLATVAAICACVTSRWLWLYMTSLHVDRVVKCQVRRDPVVVCLCGSTRFMDAFRAANLSETLAGRIVLSIGCDTKSDADLVALGELTPEAKERLDELHKRKIDLSDEILVLNVGGYIGPSTRSEIAYAMDHGKGIRYLEKHNALRTQAANREYRPGNRPKRTVEGVPFVQARVPGGFSYIPFTESSGHIC